MTIITYHENLTFLLGSWPYTITVFLKMLGYREHGNELMACSGKFPQLDVVLFAANTRGTGVPLSFFPSTPFFLLDGWTWWM